MSQSLIVMTAPSAKAETSIESRCAECGLRMTGQRRVIAQVLSSATDHPDVEEVHRRAHTIDPRISLSTVYRTLKLFSAKGILERHDFGHGRGRYEAAPREHHDHLVDIDTGRVIEFRIPISKPCRSGSRATSVSSLSDIGWNSTACRFRKRSLRAAEADERNGKRIAPRLGRSRELLQLYSTADADQALLLKVSPKAARRLPNWYHKNVCRILGITLKIDGAVVEDAPVLLVCNHTSGSIFRCFPRSHPSRSWQSSKSEAGRLFRRSRSCSGRSSSTVRGGKRQATPRRRS